MYNAYEKNPSLVLGSHCALRLALLKKIGIEPSLILPHNIEKGPLKTETPQAFSKRMAQKKAETLQKKLATTESKNGFFILTADTVVSVGRRILPKVTTEEQAFMCLNLLSGRSHRIYSGLCLINSSGKIRLRCVETRVRFKNLSPAEKKKYIMLQEWVNKKGGYSIEGFASSFVISIIGSYTNILGLPLFETMNLLSADGFSFSSFHQNNLTTNA